MALKKDWKDDQFTGNRKYNLIANADGTISLVDATTYQQNGDALTAAQLNAICNAVNYFTATLTVAGWAETSTGSGIYEQTLTGLTGTLATSKFAYGLNDDALNSATDMQSVIGYFLSHNIVITSSNTGTITFRSKSGCPTVAFTIDIVVYNV